MTVIDERPVGADDGVWLPEGMTEEECYLACILMDRSGVDQAEFLWPDQASPDGCFRLYPYQWTWFRSTDERTIEQCGRDVGKALDVTTPIPTPDGWTTMGDLVAGDQVFAEDGSICTVTHAFDRMEGRPCFEVEFDDGSVIIADGDHRWLTWSRLDQRAHSRGRKGKAAHVRTTSEIAATLRSNGELNHRIPATAPLQCEEASLPIAPYTLGAWLGDGSSYRAHITIGDEDREEMVAMIEADGYVMKKLTTPWAWAIKFPGIVNHKTGTVSAVLRQVGVLENKHIPASYLRASTAQRLALLQGIMDTDGHVTKTYGRCEITLKSERLSRDVFELAVSLGQKPYFAKKMARCNGVEAGPVYRVGFQPRDIVPFRLQRKVERVGQLRLTTRTGHRRIRDVRPVPSIPVRCIAVDSASHLFLAGTAMIPTHNSEGVCVRAGAHPFVNPGEEHALVAPEGSHLDRLTDRIEGRIRACWLLREMVIGGLRGINHRPFNINWHTGAQTYSRLPKRDGTGIKGIHAAWLDVDEGQDVSEKTYLEMPETVRFNEVEGARWCIHGVSRGVHDHFWKLTQPNSGWTVIRITKLHKPSYRKEDREQHVKEYGGSEDSGDFLRNVYGEHGSTMNRIFILHHLRACTDTRSVGSKINHDYYKTSITGDEIAARCGSKSALEASAEEATTALINMLELPHHHLNHDDSVFWSGMDVGLVNDPSEIMVLREYVADKRERAEHKKAEIAIPEEGVSRFQLMSRIRLRGIPEPLQADAIQWIIDFYNPKAFSLDAGGNGLPVFQELQKRAGKSRTILVEPLEDADDESKALYAERKRQATAALTVIKGYKFGSKIIVDFDEEKVAELGANPPLKDMIEKAGIVQEAKTRATDVLRTMVDHRRLLLPDDDELIDEMNGQTFTWSLEPVDAYGKRRAVFSVGQFHALDGMRFFALGWSQDQIEKIVNAADPPKKPVLDRFVSF